MAALFIVDPFECGRGASAGDYLDEVARIEAQQDKTKEQREAEVLQYVSTAMPRGILDAAWETAFSSHPPIRARIMRLAGLSG